MNRLELIALAADALGLVEGDIVTDRAGLVSLGDRFLEKAGALVAAAQTALECAASMPLDMQTRQAIGRRTHGA